MRLGPLVFIAVLLAALSTPLRADGQCGVISADPTCSESAKPNLSISFAEEADPASPFSSLEFTQPESAEGRALPVRRGPHPSAYCSMPVIEPDATITWSMRVVRPSPTMRFSIREIVVPPCPDDGRE